MGPLTKQLEELKGYAAKLRPLLSPDEEELLKKIVSKASDPAEAAYRSILFIWFERGSTLRLWDLVRPFGHPVNDIQIHNAATGLDSKRGRTLEEQLQIEKEHGGGEWRKEQALQTLVDDAQASGAYDEPIKFGPARTDQRPEQCRERLKEEGKLHPRSGCKACDIGMMKGCGWLEQQSPHTNYTPVDFFGDEAGNAFISALNAVHAFAQADKAPPGASVFGHLSERWSEYQIAKRKWRLDRQQEEHTGHCDSELMGTYEVAQFYGTTSQVVSTWMKRGKLPLPHVRLALGPVWLSETIRNHPNPSPTKAR